jgi:hypothetical protein
MVMVLGRE